MHLILDLQITLTFSWHATMVGSAVVDSNGQCVLHLVSRYLQIVVQPRLRVTILQDANSGRDPGFSDIEGERTWDARGLPRYWGVS